jgi:hypothetical protein
MRLATSLAAIDVRRQGPLLIETQAQPESPDATPLGNDLSICSLVGISCSSLSDARADLATALVRLPVNLERFIAWTCVGAIFAAAYIDRLLVLPFPLVGAVPN